MSSPFGRNHGKVIATSVLLAWWWDLVHVLAGTILGPINEIPNVFKNSWMNWRGESLGVLMA